MSLSPTRTKIYFDGNAAPGWWTPIDFSILQIGAVSDYSFGVNVNLRKKQTTVQNDNHCLCSFDFSYGAFQGGAFYVDAVNGSLTCFFGQTQYTSNTGLVTYEADHQIIFVIQGTTMTAYVDNVSVWVQTVARVATSFNNNSFIGQEGFQFRQLYGTMDNFFVVKRALTTAEIANIFLNIYPTNLGLWYKCNEGVGMGTIDSSGNGNTGLFSPSSSNDQWVDWRGPVLNQ